MKREKQGAVSGSARPRVVGVGIACLDYLFVASRARPGGQGEVRERLIEGGGLVGTALVAAARLGARAEIVTWVGDDAEGELVLGGLREAGVDTRGAEVIAGARTPVSFVHVEEGSGERTIYHGPRLEVGAERMGAAGGRSLSCEVLLVDGVWPAASTAAARRAREAGIPVVGDFCPGEETRELAGLVSHLIVSGGCAEGLAGGGSWEERLGRLAEMGPEFVAITAGAEGCHYVAAGKVAHQPAFAVEVVDTTGAGDVFHGAFGYGLGRGWPAARVVEFASAVAGLSCGALGGRKAIPSLEEAVGLLGEQGAEGWE